MTEEKSGLNMDTLYMDAYAAHDVAEEFRKASMQLEDLRQSVDAFFTDLGMGTCSEGSTWNDKVTDAVRLNKAGSVLTVIETCMRRLNEYAHQADLAQKEFDTMEEANKEAIRKRGEYLGKPDPSKSFPAYQ
ncbi:hypothetical protein P3F83_18730 [Mycobacteroides immunogenum]|uniref:hypothetical protein n=1 Tax=Mycobacteroides immunogenum TaxID=83262 RepID=UPI0025B771D3|nr:hypothetical protein [Mycobacteroides immunogenum]WJR32538.1 hypothetical protein P3F83_18730 [Mycobacteroides immunogenum]